MRGQRPTAAALFLCVMAACSPGGEAPRTASSETPTPEAATPSASASAREVKFPSRYFVAQTWDRFAQGVRFGDPEGAADQLSGGTFYYYERIRWMAHSAGPEAISKRPAFDRILIGYLRLRFSVAKLRSMRSFDVVQHSLRERLLTSGEIAKLRIRGIGVDDQAGRAFALLQHKGKPHGPKLRIDFIREGGEWQINLVPLIRATSTLIADVARDEGVSLDLVIDRTLEALLGAEVSADLWEKPGP